MNLVFLGPPGAGKGTMALRVKEHLGIPHISSGDMFRQAIKEETELGKQVQAILSSGKLVPDEITVGIVEERLAEGDARNGFILDGFPRTPHQAEVLSKKIDTVISFIIPESEIIKRLSGRRVCHSCGKSFHLDYIPPKVEGYCDSCGGELKIRPDDEVGTVQKRIKIYRESIEPLVNYYQKQGNYYEIDSSPTPDQVFKSLCSLLEGCETSD